MTQLAIRENWFEDFFVHVYGLGINYAVVPLRLTAVAYAILADVRPLFGCESCGTPNWWVRPVHWMIKWAKAIFGEGRHPSPSPHFTSLSATGCRPLPTSGERPPQARHF